jgi:hypothetical protein
MFNRPSHPVQVMERHGLRRPLPRVIDCITSLSAPRNEKVRTHMRIDLAPAPQPTPRHLFLHIFCNFGEPVYSLRPAASGVPSFIL